MEVKKHIWIINHYATGMYYEHAGRHYYMAKYLREKGYMPYVICANIRHNSTDSIQTGTGTYIEKVVDDIPFVFIRISNYENSKIRRVWTMLQFFMRTLSVSKNLPKPYAIIGSSVHPLACVASIKLGHRYNCRSICEIRDLWPESIVAYGILGKNNPLIRLLYSGEKWIYMKSDKVIMTWEGGYDYIIDRNWQKQIPLEKVIHISNGVDLADYKNNLQRYPYQDVDLIRTDVMKFIYTGSIRKVNNLQILVDAAEILKEKGNKKAIILVWGDGDELEVLKNEVLQKKLDNIKFKGYAKKEYIPAILNQGNVSILHNKSTSLNKYGQSQNKFFEYLAAGKPILMTYSVEHSICKSKKCGVELQEQTPKTIADAIMYFTNLKKDEYDEYCRNAANTAEEYDYPNLTNRMISVIEDIV